MGAAPLGAAADLIPGLPLEGGVLAQALRILTGKEEAERRWAAVRLGYWPTYQMT